MPPSWLQRGTISWPKAKTLQPGRRRAEKSEKLPHFLIIGAMKAGTTTLYRDMLVSMPDVFLPLDKEPDALSNDDVLTSTGRRRYAAIFDAATPGQLRGEASTSYTKRPDYEGVPQRAVRVLGTNVKIIYLMRHPIERMASQLRHELTLGWELPPPAVAVRTEPRFVFYSSYGYQLAPWMDRFERTSILPLSFENYVADRARTLQHVADFLGVRFVPSGIRQDRTYNESQGKPTFPRHWEWLQQSWVYRAWIRPRLTPELRERLRHNLLPRAKLPPIIFDSETHSFLVGRLCPDLALLRELLAQDTPSWQLSEART
jgi:hypothetical protein